MSAEVVLRQGWGADLAASPAVRAAVKKAAARTADEAGRLGREVAQSYRTTVDESSDGVRVVATTKSRTGISAAGWIELGTGDPAPTPAYAPLRRGAEAAGLTSEGTTR